METPLSGPTPEPAEGSNEDAATSAVAPFQGHDAATVKKSAGAARAEATRVLATLKRQQDLARADLDRQRAALDAEFALKRQEMENQIAPLRQQLQQMQEVMWTVDLYLGRDESLQLIRDGAPAPADTPITIRQKVLVMAEESLVLMDRKTTGMTSDNIPEFVDWLLEDDANLDRILPEQRGVVVLIPTRVESRSGNVFEDAARNAENKASYWLLRNGQRLYLLTVDPELRVSDRVLPRRTEFTEVFDRRMFGFGRLDGEPVTPGSDEWLKMEKQADARRRHYMRIMLVLQGIIDRTPVWHPLPASGVNLLSLADQDDGKIVLIQDDEQSIQLTDGRESFASWQRRLNGLLRPGLRVIGNWAVRDFSEYARDYNNHFTGRNERLSPPSVDSLPKANVPHLIEDRRDGGFVIRYERTDKVWKRDVPVPDRPGYIYRGETLTTPSRRASCLVMPDDTWVLPYDLVSVADLEYYLNSRENRSTHFLSMVPTIKAALAAKEAEALAEAPFRDLIAGLLINEGADVQDAPALMADLVQWWKIAHAWTRLLNGEPEHEAKAAREIVTEYRARVDHGDDQGTERMVRAGRRVSGAICVARNRQGKWHAYAPSTPAHDEGVFLDITPIRRDGTLGKTQQWRTVAQRTASTLYVAWSAPAWGEWKHAANPRHYLTGPERENLITQASESAPGTPICVTEFFEPTNPGQRSIACYSWIEGHTPEDAPLRATDSPLSWHYDRSDRLVTAHVWMVERTTGTPALGESVRYLGRIPSDFQHFSGKSRWGNTPWWPDDAYKYPDARPRLVWADEDMLDRIAAYTQRCADEMKRDQAARHEMTERAYRYSTPILQAIRARAEAEALERFIEDFGRDAMDLWPAHLETLGIREPIHPRDLWGLVAIAQQHGHPVVGQTLDALADFALEHRNKAPGEWHSGNSRIDVGEFGQVVVPAPED